MISRRTSITIADAYVEKFCQRSEFYVNSLYDFLFINEFEAWFCNSVRLIRSRRGLKEWSMRIHTGETLARAYPQLGIAARARLGQDYLRKLAAVFLKWSKSQHHPLMRDPYENVTQELERSLELDGYAYRDGELLIPESDVLDVKEEHGILERLYKSLLLGRHEMAIEYLRLSESHYLASRWEDCIGNSRKFFELTLEECASRYSMASNGSALPETVVGKPVKVREFLEIEKLLEKKERELVDKTYGLLSETGSHPYMAAKDQARLLRQFALTVSQFVMLRTEGAIPHAK